MFLRLSGISRRYSGVFSSLIFFSIFACYASTGCGYITSFISVSVQVSASTVDPTDSTTLMATVINDLNSAGVSWSVSGGGTLSNTSTSGATYTAPAPSSSALTVTVTATSVADTSKTASTTITVPAGLAITTSTLGAGSVSKVYNQPLAASGGIPPYTWKLAQGALPSCLSITTSSSGTSIGGTPNASCVGKFSGLIFQVTDSGTPNALSATTQSLQITIAAAPIIKFSGPTLYMGNPNAAFSGKVAATGGVGPLTYSSTGTLPSWLSLNNSTGALTGTPTAVGIYRFPVVASDAYGDSKSLAFLIGISNPSSTPIQHVVVIMQENRTFDNLFNGFPGADSASSGSNKGTVVPLSPVPLAEPTDLDHSHTGWWKAWDNGKMDGFASTQTNPALYAYSYVPQSEIQPYWTLATQYTLADQFFQSNTGPSFVAHQYMIAAQSGDADENPTSGPWGCNAPAGTTVALVGPNGKDLPGVFPCFDYTTTADLLDDNGVTWRYYAIRNGDSPDTAYQAIRHIFYGTDEETNTIAPPTQVLTDIANGVLAQVTWVSPDWAHSDHPGNNSNEGPDWVASIVNAVGASPLWNSTAIFINWDDWGGWYDHVAPVNIDAMGPGLRTPLIVVSPYAKHGYVFHEVSETASLVTFMERNFNLPNLRQRDAGANDLFDCFDFTQSPSPYSMIKTKVTVDQLLHELPTGLPDDD
jgi:phospholipase C